MRRYKERPCPGCGEVAERPPQWLCLKCRRLLELGKEREERLACLREDEEIITVAVDTGFAYNIVGRAGPRWPDIPHSTVVDLLVWLAGLESCGGTGELITEARRIYFTRGDYHYHPRHFVWATPKQADAIATILTYIYERAGAWYGAGWEDGRDLIARIATAGTDDLNRLTTGKDK